MSRFVYTDEDIKGIIVYKKSRTSDEVSVESAKVTLEEALQDIVIEWKN